METLMNSAPTPFNRSDAGLAHLLDRIAKTDGPINPNDRAVAKIYAGHLAQRSNVVRQTDRKAA